MGAYAKLRRRRQIFVDAYVECGVATAAIIKAGYQGKYPHQAAAKIYANLEVKAAIAEREAEAIAQAGMRPVRVIQEVMLMALASNESLRGENGKPVTFKDLPAEYLRASESIEFNPDGTVKSIKLAKSASLERAMKHLKLFVEAVELTGRGGAPIETKDVTPTDVSELEIARSIAHALYLGQQILSRAQARPATPLSDPPHQAPAASPDLEE
jgi:hypothetical protein